MTSIIKGEIMNVLTKEEMQTWAGLAGGIRVNDSAVYGSHEDLRQELVNARSLLREVTKAHKLPDKPGEGRSCQMTVGL